MRQVTRGLAVATSPPQPRANGALSREKTSEATKITRTVKVLRQWSNLFFCR
jgi:hypothetical protein